MAETAEVAIQVDQLNDKFVHQSLLSLEVVGGRFVKHPIKNFEKLIFPLSNVEFFAKGKFIYWTFDEDMVFFITLGMTGGFGAKNKYSALKFVFSDDTIYYNDVRHFGTFRIGNYSELKEKITSLGWDFLREEVPYDLVFKCKKYSEKTIAEVLLNQSVFAGCGNYLRSEALYKSQIHPMRLIYTLSEREILGLAENLQNLSFKSYQSGGASLKNYEDTLGNKGNFQNLLSVYSRKKDPMGNKIKKMEMADGRSVWYVPGIQV